MVAAHLAHDDPEVEHRRMVIASPLAGDDPGVSRHAAAVAADIEAMLARETRLAALPSKFGFLVDGGGVLPVRPASADIRVTLHGDACLVTADGAATGEACAPADTYGAGFHRLFGWLATPHA
jgi:precorrin-3B synthase